MWHYLSTPALNTRPLPAAAPPGEIVPLPAAAPPGEIVPLPAAAPPGEIVPLPAAAPPGEIVPLKCDTMLHTHPCTSEFETLASPLFSVHHQEETTNTPPPPCPALRQGQQGIV